MVALARWSSVSEDIYLASAGLISHRDALRRKRRARTYIATLGPEAIDERAAIWDQVVAQYQARFPHATFRTTEATFPNAGTAPGEPPNVHVTKGLLTRPSIGREGLALAIAHELGHHFGGPPRRDDGLSCEAEADDCAVRTIMRQVWPALGIVDFVEAGIQQLAAFFHESSDDASSSPGCGHPLYNDRIAAFRAANAGHPKP